MAPDQCDSTLTPSIEVLHFGIELTPPSPLADPEASVKYDFWVSAIPVTESKSGAAHTARDT